MRESCLDCARKHLTEAEILMREALMGYPEHAWLAVGHMSQAEAELLQEFPDMAHTVRAERINYIENLKFQIVKDETLEESLILVEAHDVNILSLIKELTFLEIKNEE